MNFLSLFSGIGGIDLGLERAGMRCVGQVEIDPYCRRVLAKYWPGTRQFADVREVVAWWRPERRVPEALRHRMRPFAGVDVIAGGFPCQGISNAGHKRGLEDERSGLWHEFRRIICTIRPRIAFLENVPALLVRGIDTVLGALAAGGYDAEWDCIPASAVGAPHRRDRIFVVAYAQGCGRHGAPDPIRRGGRGADGKTGALQTIPAGGLRSTLSDAAMLQRQAVQRHEPHRALPGDGIHDANGADRGEVRGAAPWEVGHPCFAGSRIGGLGAIEHWLPEPRMGRVADGVPNRVDRLRGLGNAVVPQVAEWIGRRIMAADGKAVA